jgi:hypothetical protein
MTTQRKPSVDEAGRMGGQKTLQLHGIEHFRKMGSLGQAAMRVKHPGMASIWGKLGGRPRLDSSRPPPSGQVARKEGGMADPPPSNLPGPLELKKEVKQISKPKPVMNTAQSAPNRAAAATKAIDWTAVVRRVIDLKLV